MKHWLVPVILGVVVGGCGPAKSGSETGSSGEASTGGASSSTGPGTGGGSSTGEPVTTGGTPCPELGCSDCGNGCTPEPVCDNGEVICDCGNCNESMSDSVTSGPATESAGETTIGGTIGETTDETTGSGVVCGGDMPVFPEFERTCVEDSDCTLVLHQVDCCGSMVAWGLANDAAKSFAEAEAICQAMFPMCDCAPMPTIADDGTATENVGTLTVTCKDQSCFSGQL